MDYFFSLEHQDLTGHVTVSNYPPVGGRFKATENMTVYATHPDKDAWNTRALGVLELGESRTYSAAEVFPDAVDGVKAFFLYPGDLPRKVEKLPVPTIMETRPAWRGNIQLRSSVTTASYQGEYPGGMLQIQNGTMVSLSPMVQTGYGINTSLLFVHMGLTPEIEPRSLIVGRMRDQVPIDVREIKTNSCTVIDLVEYGDRPEDPLCFFSPDTAGVPLYLSYDQGYRHMSIEHSHPPTELLVFGSVQVRREVASSLKRFWLTRMVVDSATQTDLGPV